MSWYLNSLNQMNEMKFLTLCVITWELQNIILITTYLVCFLHSWDMAINFILRLLNNLRQDNLLLLNIRAEKVGLKYLPQTQIVALEILSQILHSTICHGMEILAWCIMLSFSLYSTTVFGSAQYFYKYVIIATKNSTTIS